MLLALTSLYYEQQSLCSKTASDRNIDRLRDFLRTDQLNIAIFVVVDLQTQASHPPLQLTVCITTIQPVTALLTLQQQQLLLLVFC